MKYDEVAGVVSYTDRNGWAHYIRVTDEDMGTIYKQLRRRRTITILVCEAIVYLAGVYVGLSLC